MMQGVRPFLGKACAHWNHRRIKWGLLEQGVLEIIGSSLPISQMGKQVPRKEMICSS